MKTDAYEIINSSSVSPWLLTCDHATNHVPASVNDGDLGLPADEMERHIAFDIGAEGLTRKLSELLDAKAILSRFSRLVVDPNRGLDDPTIIMPLYDRTIIPGNRGLTETERDHRIGSYYAPYHDAYDELASAQGDTFIVAIHSFTPQLNGRARRPWHIGILYADDERFSRPLLDQLYSQSDLCVGENEPYTGHLPGDSIDRHALGPKRPNALIEVRQDLIETPNGQREWAERLAPLLDAARQNTNL